jgi:hypothetical protein
MTVWTRFLSPSARGWVIAATLINMPALALAQSNGSSKQAPSVPNEGWVSLFNGKNLDGWTPKITGHLPGENYADTFRVENGVIKVSYDKYGQFNGTYGHLFYKKSFSHYRLRVEYRFVGEQAPGGQSWAFRNSGVMIHSQGPATMRRAQEFPVSIEVQFLGGTGKGERTTGNLCTPGTNVVIDGKLVTRHCTASTSKTYNGDQWVTAEVECHGNGAITHFVDGKPVIRYEKPQLDPKDADARGLIDAQGGNLMLREGFIALQSESHPIEFRKVEIMELKE